MIRRRDVSMLPTPLLGGCSRPGGSTIIRVALITGQNITFDAAKSLGYFEGSGAKSKR